MFVLDHDPNLKGNVAELKIAAEAARLGIPVLRPMTEHERYDLVFELGGGLQRIQCKSAPRRGHVVVVTFVTNPARTERVHSHEIHLRRDRRGGGLLSGTRRVLLPTDDED